MSWVQIDGETHDVPLAPILGLLSLTILWPLEFVALAVHLSSHGVRPTSEKLWILSGVTIAITVYKLTLRRRHKAYDKYIRTGSRLQLSNLHSWVVVGTVICYSAFATWILFGR
jgi:hypothetical protein